MTKVREKLPIVGQAKAEEFVPRLVDKPSSGDAGPSGDDRPGNS